MSEFVVELKSIEKSFGDALANADINLRVRAGSIHAIIGENGAGKSTAMKVLYGLYAPDAGSVLVDGMERTLRSPEDALALGIGMVQQHFLLAGPLSGLDNVLLGIEPTRMNWLPRFLRPINRASAGAHLHELACSYGMEFDEQRPVEDLSVATQQRVEILKLLYRKARILILDEPTAVLSPPETQDLFRNLRGLAKQGCTILIITHKLKEVMELADEVTVFRAGRVVGHRLIATTNVAELGELMVGSRMSPHQVAAAGESHEAPLLKVSGLSFVRGGKQIIKKVSFEVRPGEIVGIAGVHGNGQSELMKLLLDPEPWLKKSTNSKGRIEVLGQDSERVTAAAWKRDPQLAYISEDRHHEGLLLDRPLLENFLLGLQRIAGFSTRGILDAKNLRARFAMAMKTFDVRGGGVELAARALSGGNQQKLIAARELERQPRLLLASEPTRGVDLGAIHFLHEKFLELRARGSAVLLVSSDLDEILSLSDRVLVMYKGAIIRDFRRGGCTERELGAAMGGL